MYRSLLFLPGNNPNMLINGDILGADAVIFDLEDAVSPREKDAARILVRNVLQSLRYGHVGTIVRINAVDDTDDWRRDLEEVVPCRPSAVMLVKVPDAAYVRTVSQTLGELEARFGVEAGAIHMIPLIEKTEGLENAFSIASADSRVEGLVLGAEDLTADMRCARTKEGKEIFYARSRMVSAGRAAGVEVYDTPFTDVYDDESFLKDAALAKSLGFSGKAAISPQHVRAINRLFSPTDKEIAYALEVLEAIEEGKRLGKGAVSLRGKMIDAPIVDRAKQVLETDRRIKEKERINEKDRNGGKRA
ncbi:MAG: CoA ester lyase [Synergistaceae bacterium]|jgi:citrate lyase subunit beta/citryl-CoA lyase|nr:CoA ester lyase [Synergistaceae bacterium]